MSTKRCCDKNKPDFNSLLALLLIALQFGKEKDHGHDHHEEGLIDNSILFLVALYFVLCGCCGLKRGC